MKKLTLFLALFSSLSTLAQGEEALVTAMRAKLAKVRDYTATAVMKVNVPFISANPSNVTVYYKQPNKFNIKKEGGISLLPKGGVSVNLAQLLQDANYTVVPAGKAVVKGVTTKVVKLLPLSETSTVVITTLYIDEAALLIRKAAVTTRDNGSYEMEFNYGKWSAWGLPTAMAFVFSTAEYKLPKGVTFEYENGRKKAPVPKGSKGRVEIAYSNYIINKGVPDAAFINK